MPPHVAALCQALERRAEQHELPLRLPILPDDPRVRELHVTPHRIHVQDLGVHDD